MILQPCSLRCPAFAASPQQLGWTQKPNFSRESTFRKHASPDHCGAAAAGLCEGSHGEGPADKLSRREAFATTAAAVASLALVSSARPADAKTAPGSGGDWTSPGLAAVEDDAAPRFIKTGSGVKMQELRVGSGPAAKRGDKVLLEYVLRRGNGYFIYSTVDGVSFQPRDIETGPILLTLGDGRNIGGLEEVIIGMQPAGKRRALIPPELGYTQEGLLPQPPGYAAKRQVINHSREGLIFEVQLVKIRSSA